MKNMAPTAIGTFIKAYRNDAKMTQQDLAIKIGFTRNMISNIERGASVFPIARTEAFITALEIPKDAFLNILRVDHPKKKILTLFSPKKESLPVPKSIDDRTCLFDFKGQKITTILDKKNSPWWIVREVCDVLGLENVTRAVSSLDDDEKNTFTINKGIPGNPTKLVINEPGLFTLILRSRKPAAKKFKRWVTHEVLPALRKTGRYEMETTSPVDLPPLDRQILKTVRKYLSKGMNITNREWTEKVQKITVECSIVKDERDQLKLQLEEYKEKAQGFERLCERRKGINYTDAANFLGIRPTDFRFFMEQKKYINKHGRPYSKYHVGKQFFTAREKENPKTGVWYHDYLITMKGLNHFAQLIEDGKFELDMKF